MSDRELRGESHEPTPFRVAVVLTHPVQYFSPWFRTIHACEPRLALTVLYATELLPEAQATGFGGVFEWDVPLLEGYPSRVLATAPAAVDVSADRYSRVDAPALDDALDEIAPEFVLVPGWHAAFYARARRWCRRRGVPMIYRGDTTLASGPRGVARAAWRLHTRRRLADYSAYLSVGVRAREYLASFGVPEPLIFDSPHAVDVARFSSAACAASRANARAAFGLPAEAFVVLFAGKLQAAKRPLDAVRAVARLGAQARLLVAGRGPLEAACRAEADRLQVAVTWAGFVNQSAMAQAYRAADCLVLPGRETWGLVVNEALACGVPAVVTDEVGCQPDLVVEGETGAVAPYGDVDALGRALGRVRHALQSGHAFAPACRHRASRYSFAAATAGLVAACDRLRRREEGRRQRRAGRPRVLAACTHMVIAGGLERMSFEVIRALIEHGAGVHCCVNTWDSSRIVTLAEGAGADWSPRHTWHTLTRRSLTPVLIARMAAEVALSSLDLLRAARDVRADTVFVPDFLVPVRMLPAVAVLRLLGRRVVLRVGVAPGLGRFYRALWRWIVSPSVDRIVCNSEFIRREVLATGVPARKVGLIRNCVSTRPASVGATPACAPNPWQVIYVGQIIPTKGLIGLLEAVALLRREGLPVTLAVVGDMDRWEPDSYRGFQARVRARAAEPDLQGGVTFLGHREDVRGLLERAGVHCCPSTLESREGMTNVVLEAKAAGIPSVVTASGSLPELVEHGVDGWISDESSGSIAGGLRYFLVDPQRRARAGARARQSLARFDRESFARAWQQEFGMDGAHQARRTAGAYDGPGSHLTGSM